MKLKHLLFIPLLLISFVQLTNAQVFWFENWTGTTCNKGCTTYTGPNGAWSVDSTGANGTYSNDWFFSYQEQGMGRGVCGSGTGTRATAHVGNVAGSPASALFCPAGDCGAAYDATDATIITNKRLKSPVINCTGQSTINLSFNYIMAGQEGYDNDTVEYFDGTTWNFLAIPAMSVNTGCLGQGRWTYYSVALPASANNNPNVQIGFKWENNGDNSGNDPSFAVDSITLTGTPSGSPPVASYVVSSDTICVGDSIFFGDVSTNGPLTWNWTFQHGNPATSTHQTQWVVYSTSGTDSVKLVVTNLSGSDSTVGTVYIMPKGIATVTATPDTICPQDTSILRVAGGTAWRWSNGKTSSSIAVYPVTTTTYTVLVTVQCGVDTLTKTVNVKGCTELGIPAVSAINNSRIFPNPNNGRFTINMNEPNDRIEFYNVLGEEIYSRSLLNATNNLNLGKVPAGVYLYKIISANNSTLSLGKFVVE